MLRSAEGESGALIFGFRFSIGGVGGGETEIRKSKILNPMSNRTVRVNELVQRELSAILHQNYQSETVAVTITEVRVSPDLRDARVFVSVLGDDETATAKVRWIRDRAVDIRQELGRRIVLKFLPKFEYVVDQTALRTSRISLALDEMKLGEPTLLAEGEPPAGES